MLFNSTDFLIFFLLVFGLYHVLNLRGQNVLLLVASNIFYGWWDWRFLLLIWVSILTDFTIARKLAQTEDPVRRKILLGCSLTVGLGILGFFKYFNFFTDSALALLRLAGLEADPVILQIVLPVGVSFYTFQSLSYTVDVYRRKLEPTQDLSLYALFVSYFPQLVAGPIERAGHLIGQLARPRRVEMEDISRGLWLMGLGFFKKMAVADSVSPLVEQAFAAPESAGWITLHAGMWLFALQIYCDFSGYTDIARGCSRLLGVDLMENFRQPYFAANITDFWRRWHISLSTWLRDYLYITLGGNRQGRWRTYGNLMLTMLLGGLWHGANWTFVIWGGLHGIFLAGHKAWMEWRGEERAPSRAGRIVGWLATLWLVALAWVFFRAPDLPTAMTYLQGLAAVQSLTPEDGWSLVVLLFFTGLVFIIDAPQFFRSDAWAAYQWTWPLRGAYMALLILLFILISENREAAFIYFQF
jgi:alginate O-acetyltransferase complex protein AlgI